jgi:hypothetical protein
VKIKGVVDGFRNPRPEYYHIKMAQTPIALGSQAEPNKDGVTLQATNRYSFTDLAQLRAGWTLSAGSRKLASGTMHLALPARSNGALRLELPAGKLAIADTLRLDFDHPGGWNVAAYQFVFKPVEHAAPLVQVIAGLTFPTFNLVTGTNAPGDKGWRLLARATGELVNVTVQRRSKPTAAMNAAELATLPMAEVESLEADVVLQPGSVAAGHLHAELSGGRLNYSFTWSGARSDVFELGWVFSLPKGVERFSWDRKAAWSYYPPDHIGRPTGTATPESAHVDVTRVDRPDAFDFNSTKFDCNWASLTDRAGRGLCLQFAPEQRHHVRGGFARGGGCTLVVNRCYSPPRDIFSNIVPDLYTVMNKGDRVAGGFQIGGGL